MDARRLTLVMVALVVLLLPSLLFMSCSDEDDSPTGPTTSWDWRPLGDGMNGYVGAVQSFDGRLYAGGGFTEAGGVSANYIAVWNDTAWAPLGSGTSWPVLAFTIYDGKLIVGGKFSTAGGMVVNRVAAYDGTTWSAMGGGIAGDIVVQALCVVNDTLFAVGSEGIGLNAEAFVAAWDGASWGMIESGNPGSALAACMYENNLVVGGYTLAGSNVEPFVKRMNGGAWWDWQSASLSGMVYDLLTWNGNTYFAGIGARPVRYMSVSWWDVGEEFFAGVSISPQVQALHAFGGNLVACGHFISIGGTTVNSVAAWNGTSWTALGTGMTSGTRAYCLGSMNDQLYVGGDFVEMGGDTVNNIAEWSLK